MGKFKSKKVKTKTKKRKLLKFIIFISLIYLFSYFSFNYFDNKISYTSNKNFLDIVLTTSNFNNSNKLKGINKFLRKITNIDFANPVSVLDEGIKNNIVKIDNSEDNYDNYSELEKVSKYIENPNKNEAIKDPIVYLYNSHQLENYNKADNEIYNISPNVMLTSYMLKENLENYKISSIVEEEDINELLRINNWKGSAAYKASRILINNAISKNSSLKYFIDLHRDSVKYNYTTLKTAEKSYAKFYFVIGLEHDNYEKNLAFATKLSDMLNKEIKGISKGILAKKGKNVNGIYNQDINSNVILIEVGGVDNNIEEVKNSIEILAKVLSEYIKGDTNS